MKFWKICIFTLITGCATNVTTWDEFVPLYAQEKCLVYKQCYRAHYEGEYGNNAQCKDAVMQELQQSQGDYENCTFVPASANECLEKVRTSSCGSYWSEETNIYQSCREDIWACTSE